MILLGLLKLLILILVIGFAIGLIVIIGFVKSIKTTHDKLMGKSPKGFGASQNGSPRSRTYTDDGRRQRRAGRKIIDDDEGEYVDYEEIK